MGIVNGVLKISSAGLKKALPAVSKRAPILSEFSADLISIGNKTNSQHVVKNFNLKSVLNFVKNIFSKNNPPKTVKISDDLFKKTFGNLEAFLGERGNAKDLVNFKKPPKLLKGLKEITEIKQKNHIHNIPEGLVESFIQELEKSGLYKGRKIKGIIGVGSKTAAFELDNQEVLKIAFSNNLTTRPHNSLFDLPVLDSGKIGDVYYYIQPKADRTSLTTEHVVDVINKIKFSGYTPRDLQSNRFDQIGLYKGKPYLIDRECARQAV